ncbi:MAG: methyltransferase domain-containing protein [Acidobacteriota bacterium]
MTVSPRRSTPELALEDCKPVAQALDRGVSRRVLDLACGDGRIARWLATRGYQVTAIDASESILDAARAAENEREVEYLLGDMGAVERLVRGHYGAAFCLGNALPYLLSPESLSRMLFGLRRRLLPGAPVLVQVNNYERFTVSRKQVLATDIVEHEDGDLVVLQLVEPRPDGIVTHTTSTLRHQPAGDPMMEVVVTRANQLRAWTRSELETMLDVARFEVIEAFGSLAGDPYDEQLSPELVLLAK